MALRAFFQMVRSQAPVLGEGRIAAKDWYVFFYNLYNAVTQGLPQPVETLTLGASPFDYTAVIRGQLNVAGGTVSAISLSRDGTTFFTAGLTAGFVQMNTGDVARVTYTVAPTLTYFPM